ncbi:ADP-ribosylglycohydrolase family protein [Roseovarius sp. 2305UL8-3]|uniref:ADP-ribosylglycohydrolase family protein n=1 Tax=Roseovarius conchicola TaxID=3121636 RepID=UPI003529AFFB
MPDPSPLSLTDRALGAFWGLALGDALGMPSQTLTCAEIRAHYGQITDFIAPFEDHPFSHGLKAAQVTDDTEQALLLAMRLIAEPGGFDAVGWAKDLLAWEADIRCRGLRDLLGPSTKAALDAILAGVDPDEASKGGTTNGAAMRVAPIGIATAADDIKALVDQVELSSRVTHNTGEAIAGASAVAAMISALLDGATIEAAFGIALQAASEGQKRGHAAGVSDMAARIEAAVTFAKTAPGVEGFADAVGTSVASHHAVPAAFGLLFMSAGDAWATAVMAANIGDDTDTIGAIAAAMAGAASGMAALPQGKLAALRAANDLEIAGIVDGLLNLRRKGISE